MACYLVALRVRRLARNHPAVNPTLVSMLLVGALLFATHTSYIIYFRATWVITFLLAPATVALGVPLARNFIHVRRNLIGVGLGLLAGSVVSMLAGVFLVRWLGGNHELAMSMLPKAATTPIAMAVAVGVGGQPAMTAVLAIAGGIIAAVTLRGVLGIFRVKDNHAIGLAAGTAGSGIAAASVAELGDGAAAFAAVGIGLNGLLTALLAPWVAAFFK